MAAYRHQVDDLALAGPALLTKHASPFDALSAWIAMFVGFLVMKHGLASALNPASSGFATLYEQFLDALLPVCTGPPSGVRTRW